jgi:predicted phage terminase large subunit-like protein
MKQAMKLAMTKSSVPSTAQASDALARRFMFAFLIKAFFTLQGNTATFHQKWFLKVMCRALERVKDGDLTRAIFEVPPRHLKSITISVAFSAWMLGHNPRLRIMVVSYGAELAKKHARDLRTVMRSSWYKELFPNTNIVGDTVDELITSFGGGRLAVSIGGAVTGFGADIIIIDDSLKAGERDSEAALRTVESFYSKTVYSRLNNPQKGSILIIQQRIAERDLVGVVKDIGGYECFSFPAEAVTAQTFDLGRGETYHRAIGELLYPEVFSKVVLDDLRRNLGPQAYAAQYQQDPTAPEGNRIRMEWFGSYEIAPPREHFARVVLSIDAAASDFPGSDYSVCTVWGYASGKWYLLDLFRERLVYPRLKSRVMEAMAHWKADKVVIEKASNGAALFQDLFYTENYRGRILDVTSQMNKALRVEAATAELESGKFLLPKEAPWLSELARELRAFPAGRFDDQVDSVVQLVNWQKHPTNKSFVDPQPHAIMSKRHRPLKHRILDRYR